MAIIYVVRHAQSEGNLFRRFQGQLNCDVTPLGLEQIAALKKRFKEIPVEAVYASDLKRTMATAHAAADPHGLDILPRPQLREFHAGVYDDLPYAEFKARFPQQEQYFQQRSPLWAPEGGETFQQVADRMKEAFFRIAGDHPDGTVALFSHGIAIQCLRSALRGLPPHELTQTQSGNTAVSCYEVRGDKVRILFENDSSHLPTALVSQPGRAQPVRFRAMEADKEEALYRQARREGWLAAHADLLDFDGPGFWDEAREQQLWDPRALQCAVLDGQAVGILQLDTLRGAQAGVGNLPFLWVREDLRRKGVGAQLIGQAMYTYRQMGRHTLRLRCSPANRGARQFYQSLGFRKTGEVPGAAGALDLLEKGL